MSRVIGLDHVSLLVADTGRSLQFYREILGLALEPGRPELGFPGAWLRLGDRQLHLLELPGPDPRDGRPAHGGRDRHTAVRVSDLAAFAARLDGAGIPYTMSRSGRRALFCRDPDGNAWELIEAKQAEPGTALE
jgi:glyoxylase I family protein